MAGFAVCPNKSHPKWKALVRAHGSREAYRMFLENGGEIPDVDYRGGKYSDIQLKDWKFRSFEHIADFGERYMAMSQFMKEVKADGGLSQIKAEGVKYLPGSNRGASYVSSEISTNGKLTGVNFPIGENERELYGRNAGRVIEDLLQDKRVLFFRGDNHSSFTNSGQQGKEGLHERTESAHKYLWEESEAGTSYQEVMGKSLQELFDSPDRDQPVYRTAIGYFIASRLLQSSDNFSGRILSQLRKDRLVDLAYVRIENDKNRDFLYADGKAVYLNLDKLPLELSKYTTADDFMKGIDLALTEEAIHAVAINQVSDKEIADIYKELQDSGQLDEFKKTYNFREATPFAVVHEYIRTIIQEDIFGTSSARELKITPTPGIRNILMKALDYIINVFRKNPTPVAKEVIDRMKGYINKSTENKLYLQQSDNQKTIKYELQRILKGESNTPEDNNIQTAANYFRTNEGAGSKSGQETFTKGNKVVNGLQIYSSPDKGLDTKIEGFINSLGGSVRYVPQIVVDGQVVDANAVADVINRTIEIAGGKATVDTLPEEAAHIYVEWLPAGSKLLKDMMRDITKREIYTDTYEEYKGNPLYQNPDGSVNEDKIAKEAIGKMIAGTIVGQYTDQKARSFLQRIIDWIKSIFTGKDFNGYKVAATDILSGNTKRLDLSGILETNKRGEFYLQLSPEEEDYIREMRKRATSEQQLVMDKVFLEPENRVTLNEKDHIYTDNEGNVYSSTTSLINGEFEENEDYILNREWGNDFDRILQGIALGKELSDIPTGYIPEQMRESAYKVLTDVYNELTSDGSILLPQVIVADKGSKVAGSIDLLQIHPDGSRTVIDLKTYRDDRSLNTGYSPAEGSVFYNDPGVSTLSKSQKHAIQVASYKKLLTLMGFPYSNTAIKYIGLQVTGSKKEQQLHSFKEGNLVPLTNTSYDSYADKVVPGIWDGKDILAELNATDPERLRQQAIEDEEYRKRVQEELQQSTQNIYKGLESWKEKIEAMRHQLEVITDTTVYNTDKLIAIMEEAADEKKDYGQAYVVFLEAAAKQLQRLSNYLSARDADGNLKHYYDKSFFKVSQLADNYINTFQGLVGAKRFHLTVLDTPAKQQLLYKVTNLFEEVGQAIKGVQDEAYKRTLTDNLSKELTEAALKELMEKDRDLTEGRKWAGSLGGTHILEAESKRITLAREQVHQYVEETEEQLNRAANKLRAAGITDFKFMTEYDKSGKPTGRLINDVGSEYIRLANEAEEGLLNDDGTYRQYTEIGDLRTADPQAVKENIDLYYAKEKRREFMRAEEPITNEKGDVTGVEDGKYHRYTDKFKEERRYFMVLNSKGKWVLKKIPGALEWRRDNFTYRPYTTLVFKNNKPTGQTRLVEGDAAYFPKEINVVKREVASDGTRLVDDKYYTLMNPKTDKERAQLEYYKTHMKIFKEAVDKLPPWVMDWFTKGYMPALRGNLLELIGQQGVDTGALILSNMKGSITSKAYMSHGRDQGGIPIMFISSIQDEMRLKALNEQLNALIARKDSMSFKEYSKQFDTIKNLIKVEASKIKAQEINPDMVAGLKAFIAMSENYNIMSRIEDELLTVLEKMKKMDWTQEKGVLGIKQTRDVKGEQSNAVAKLTDWIAQNLYSNDKFTKDMSELVIKRLQNFTSVISIAGNITGMLNNAILARVNNRLESFGNDFYEQKALNRAIKEFDTKFLPGYVKTQLEYRNRNKTTDKYSKKKAGSKYEALVEKYHMIKHSNRAGTGKVGWLAKLWGYKGYEAGEYMVQSQVGIAILGTATLKNSKTGEECSIYDAHEFNPNTGKLTLREGFEHSMKEQAAITHRIWKTNERIHGNYDDMEKIMLEKSVLGKLMLQFHKWVWPNFQARFQRNQYEEGLGEGMEVEGRYITLAHFLKQFIRAGINIDRQRENWATLSEHQKHNLLKDAADLLYIAIFITTGTIVKAAAEGIPDDDPYMKKLANWIQYQSDRGVQEVSLFVPLWGEVEAYQMFKNPFAVTSSLKKFAYLGASAIKYPFQDEDTRLYRTGAFKGQLKVTKQFRDLVPLYRELNQWTQLDVQHNFYIP